MFEMLHVFHSLYIAIWYYTPLHVARIDNVETSVCPQTNDNNKCLTHITEGAWYEKTCLRPLLWRHNGCDSVSNHQPHDRLLDRLYRRRSKKTSKLCVTGLCAGNYREPVNSPHKWPVTWKMFPFDDVIMLRPGTRPSATTKLRQLWQ